MPAIAKILIVFFGMLALTRMKIPLFLALIIGGLTLAVLAGLPPLDSLWLLVKSLCLLRLWLLLAITILVVEFGRYITEKENSEAIIGAIKKWGGRHGRVWTMTMVPAVVGLIPMPAGALFSAPFVQQAIGDNKHAPAWRTAVNYWFRHVWEYWWPLYPGVIVAMSVFQMENWQFLATQVPFTVVSITAGYIFLIRPHVQDFCSDTTTELVDNRRVFIAGMPLLLVIASVIFLPFALKNIAPFISVQNRKMLAMLVGLLAGVTLITRDEMKRGMKLAVFSSVLKPKSRGILLTIVGIMTFQYFLEQSGLVILAGEEIGGRGIVVVIAVLPFLAGMVTGVAVGFTGISFPLVVGLMNGPNSGLTPMSTLALAYGCGYMGMMLSPIHLCLLVSKDYFGSRLPPVYKYIIPCVTTILVFTTLAHIFLRAMGA
ncbi:MAG: DUF401 family protein [Lentisphaerae bacterium]|nr:DUF401 family protein [Lentisphaerota bacterium]